MFLAILVHLGILLQLFLLLRLLKLTLAEMGITP